MRTSVFSILTAAAVILLSGCTKIKKSDAEYERENWIQSFSDSIQYYQQRSGDITIKLDGINKDIDHMLVDFEKVNNPREVAGYFILKGWSDKIPLRSTGIYARINENEKLELIATLSGATFNTIAVGDGNNTYISETVPHDQAFNYRHSRFNTVYFSGGKADTVCQYIADHYKDKCRLEFLEGNKKTNFIIPENERDMIRKTWELYSKQREARSLQKELLICSKKIDTFHRIQDEAAESQENK